jgi:polar amino acid transport system substrate-binding protein
LVCLALASCLAGARQANAEELADDFVPSFVDAGAARTRPVLDPGTTIRFVTTTDYPPFDFPDPHGTLVGFNVDLAKALCSELQVPCTIQARGWSDLVPALKNNEADAVIASQKITAAARRDVAFTWPYYKTPARFVTRTGSAADVPTPSALKGRTVAAEGGTAQEAYLRTFFPGVTVVVYPTAAAAHAALKDGKVDALFADGIEAALWLGSDDAAGCCAFRGGPFTESRYFGEGAGIALRPADADLRRALNDALARITTSGVYADLYLKWFPLGFY